MHIHWRHCHSSSSCVCAMGMRVYSFVRSFVCWVTRELRFNLKEIRASNHSSFVRLSLRRSRVLSTGLHITVCTGTELICEMWVVCAMNVHSTHFFLSNAQAANNNVSCVRVKHTSPMGSPSSPPSLARTQQFPFNVNKIFSHNSFVARTLWHWLQTQHHQRRRRRRH